jgi:hypothetical protein
VASETRWRVFGTGEDSQIRDTYDPEREEESAEAEHRWMFDAAGVGSFSVERLGSVGQGDRVMVELTVSAPSAEAAVVLARSVFAVAVPTVVFSEIRAEPITPYWAKDVSVAQSSEPPSATPPSDHGGFQGRYADLFDHAYAVCYDVSFRGVTADPPGSGPRVFSATHAHPLEAAESADPDDELEMYAVQTGCFAGQKAAFAAAGSTPPAAWADYPPPEPPVEPPRS